MKNILKGFVVLVAVSLCGNAWALVGRITVINDADKDIKVSWISSNVYNAPGFDLMSGTQIEATTTPKTIKKGASKTFGIVDRSNRAKGISAGRAIVVEYAGNKYATIVLSDRGEISFKGEAGFEY